MTTLFHDSFFFLLKPWELVTLRAGIGPISWPERPKTLHLMEPITGACQASGTLDFNCPLLACFARKPETALALPVVQKPCYKLEEQGSPLGNVAGSPLAAAGTLASWAEEPALRQPSLQHPNKPSAHYKSSNSTPHSPDTAKYSPKYYKTLLSSSSYTLPSCHHLQGPLLDCFKSLKLSHRFSKLELRLSPGPRLVP